MENGELLWLALVMKEKLEVEGNIPDVAMVVAPNQSEAIRRIQEAPQRQAYWKEGKSKIRILRIFPLLAPLSALTSKCEISAGQSPTSLVWSGDLSRVFCSSPEGTFLERMIFEGYEWGHLGPKQEQSATGRRKGENRSRKPSGASSKTGRRRRRSDSSEALDSRPRRRQKGSATPALVSAASSRKTTETRSTASCTTPRRRRNRQS